MRSKTMLLVEDNPDDVELALRAFAKHGMVHQITVARDGMEALALLHGSAPEAEPALVPEVVLLDLNLPLLNGHEVLRRLRADPRTRRIPVVMLTSSQEDKDILASYDLGANSFVQKPVDFLEFVEAARQLGQYWLLLNQSPNR
ncbi:MAG TPA: response regulator [Polyangiaceae bacterium]|jgi:two-component system response regulator|nr:response regulator [Polyangiaceae bacterium]